MSFVFSHAIVMSGDTSSGFLARLWIVPNLMDSQILSIYDEDVESDHISL